MLKNRLLLILCCTLIAGLLMTGCSKQQSTHLRYAVGAEPESIDPRKSTSIAASTIEAQLFEGLTVLDAANRPAPAAAERWEVSADGLVYVFHLRQAAKWSNGESVTAHDFEYAWKTCLSPDFASPYAYQMFYIKNGEAYHNKKASADQVGVKALNDYTLEVRLERPAPYFLSLTAFHTYYPVHQKTVAANGKWATDAKSVVGNGPFLLTLWQHSSKMELAKNPHYWDAASVKLARMEFLLLDSASTVMAMFERNQIDIGDNLPASEIPRLLAEKKVQIQPQLGVGYYSFNMQKAPFDNAKVRKAFQLAIDREVLVKKVLQGGQQPAFALVPTGLADVKPGEDFRKVGGDLLKNNDIETAKRLLAEAGFPDGKGLPPITLLYNTSETHKMMAEAIQEMWKKNLGVLVQLSNQEWKVFLDSLDRHEFQMARDSWVGDYADPMTFIELFEMTNGNNVPDYKNPDYDALVNQAKKTPDQQTRMQAMHAAEKLLIDDAVIIPLYYYTSPSLVKDRVKGTMRSIFGNIYFKNAYLQ
ncbi:ABC transporter substrate-binding protein [Anaerosporomusa subterranea]|uniref:ABC transporter substrate-binding protein n=1 Tax=Anaerosporomusa subterranea TaxID=1794912 RepID=A0A154BVZ8_ANASB|nr:peptide ABC transporter substrate-binding protein [Anaerosporomusa subterranea]KYZ78203.1 ABC transporter substrate-binding protein [Anaerosporomusa subterranea]